MTEWQTKKLGDLAVVLRGSTITRKEVTPGEVPVIAGGQTPSCYHNVSNRDGKTITVSASGAYAGFVQYFEIPIFASDCSTIKVKDENQTSSKFLFYMLQASQTEIYAFQRGSGQPHVYPSQLVGLDIPTPPIDEQHKIVEVLEGHLSNLDAALADVKLARTKAIQFRRSLLQSAFAGKFIDKSRYAEAKWPITTLGELCNFITDGSHNPPKGIEKSEYLMLSSRDINNGALTFDKPRYLSKADFEIENKRTDLQIDDVLLTTVGTIGRTAIYSGIPKNVTFQRSVSVLRTNKEKLSPKFLMYFLDSITELLNREARGVAQQGIYLNQVRKLEIPVPTLDEQLFLVEFLDDRLSRLDSSVKLVDLMEKQAVALRRALLQAAFNGQLTKEVVSV
jgi:restriction endonuclease S subunit